MLATLGYSIAGGLQAGTGGLATLGYGIGEAASPLIAYCIDEAQFYSAGLSVGEVYTPGLDTFSVYVPGAIIGQVGCD